MDAPLLTIYTPTYRRPQGLARCRESVAAQTAVARVQHLVIEDTVGLGIDGMYAAMPQHHDAVRGQWVYVLSDDDVLPDPLVVEEFARLAEATDADVIMAHAQIGPFVYPSPHCWQAPPEQGHVTLSNWFVRREVFVRVPYGARYEGDYDFIAGCWARGLRFAWWPRLVCVAAGWSRGAPEEGA